MHDPRYQGGSPGIFGETANSRATEPRSASQAQLQAVAEKIAGNNAHLSSLVGMAEDLCDRIYGLGGVNASRDDSSSTWDGAIGLVICQVEETPDILARLEAALRRLQDLA